MQPRLPADVHAGAGAGAGAVQHDDRMALRHRAARILWPAFLMAGMLELAVFAVVDPADLHWFGGGPQLGWSNSAVYSVTFLLFWAAVATAGALTALLDADPAALDGLGR